jgi:peptide/nickel transport system substrate-binding protein
MRVNTLAHRVLAGAAVLLLLGACRTPGEQPVPTPRPSPTPRPFTVMSTDQIRVADPAAITDAASTVLSLNVFQRLMTADPGGSVLKPDAARDCLFTSSTTYTCTLNEKLAFHNGHPLTSSDVKFSIERAARLNVPGSSAVSLSSLRRIQTPDQRTVRFVLSRVDTQFGWALASPAASIVDEELYDADRVRGPNDPIVGSGPFVVNKYTGNQLQLSRYADYVGRNPAQLPDLVYRSVADSPTIEDAMTKGTVDVVCHPIQPAGDTEREPRDNQRLYAERVGRRACAATRMVADCAHAVEQAVTAGDRGCPARRPHVGFHRPNRGGGTYSGISAGWKGQAEGDLEEPYQPHAGL